MIDLCVCFRPDCHVCAQGNSAQYGGAIHMEQLANGRVLIDTCQVINNSASIVSHTQTHTHTP